MRMETLLLTAKGGIIRRGKAFSGDPLPLMPLTVTLEPGFTLSSFFAMVAANPVFMRLSELLEPLAAMAADAGKDYPKAGEIDSLVFYKTIAMRGFPGKPGIEIYNSLKGVKADNPVGLKFFQMESLLEHDFCLGHLNHIIFGDSQDMFTYDTHYSLFELIEGVTWELSFNFNPLQCSIRG